MGLGRSVLGDNTRTRLMTSVTKDSPWKSPGEGLCRGQQEAGTQAYEDLG